MPILLVLVLLLAPASSRLVAPASSSLSTGACSPSLNLMPVGVWPIGQPGALLAIDYWLIHNSCCHKSPTTPHHTTPHHHHHHTPPGQQLWSKADSFVTRFLESFSYNSLKVHIISPTSTPVLTKSLIKISFTCDNISWKLKASEGKILGKCKFLSGVS